MIKVGEKLGRFELVRELGRGSHGVVFEATDTLLGEKVAIKALQPWLSGDPTLRERFKRELILTRRVAHPGVCRLFDLHEENEAFFISMQYVEGRSLSMLLRDEAPSLPRIIRLLRGICSALSAAHEQGVVHRDLKPANVMVGPKDQVVVLDFGIATATGVGQLTRPGQALGSVPFIAPEIWEGQPATPLGDQYALGVMAFAAATGTLPYRGQNPLEIVDAIRATKPTMRERRPDIDAAYEAVVLRAMARQPGDRFPDVRAFEHALEHLAPIVTSPGLSSGSALPQPVTMETPVSTSMAPSDASSPRPLPSPSSSSLSDVTQVTRGVSQELEPLTISSGVVDVTPFKPSESTVEVRVLQATTDTLSRRSDDDDLDKLPPNRLPLLVAAGAAVVVIVVLIAVLVSGGSEGVTDAGVAAVADDAGAAVVAIVDANPTDPKPTNPTEPTNPTNPTDPKPTDPTNPTATDPTANPTANPTNPTPTDPLEPPLVDVDPVRPRPSDPVASLQLDALSRGVRAGDVPAFDDALGRARRATDKAAREKLSGDARKVLAAIVVDKAFVGRKLAYFNAAFDRAPAATQKKLTPISKEVMARFAKSDWQGANARLNRGFDVLAKNK